MNSDNMEKERKKLLQLVEKFGVEKTLEITAMNITMLRETLVFIRTLYEMERGKTEL